MKEINKLQPNVLVGMRFTIPIFSAKTQLYECIEVADLGADLESRKYGLYFKWLPTSYNVPEILRLDITISNYHNTIDIELFDKNLTGNYDKLFHKIYGIEAISTIPNIQKVLIDLNN